MVGMQMIKAIKLFLQVFTFFLIADSSAYAQKIEIDTGIINHWNRVGEGQISGDGRYIFYCITDSPRYHNTVVLRSSASDWQKDLVDAQNPLFSDDSRFAFWVNGKGDLSLLSLKNKHVEVFSGIFEYKINSFGGSSWLACRKTDDKKQLLIWKVGSDERCTVKNVNQYFFYSGRLFLLITKSDGKQSLQYIDLKSKKNHEIWLGMDAGNFIFGSSGDNLSFISKGDGQKSKNKILWTYHLQERLARMLPIDKFRLESAIAFSPSGKGIFLSLSDTVKLRGSNVVNVEVWSYKDSILPSERILNNGRVYFNAFFNTETNSLVRLGYANEYSKSWNDDIALVGHLARDTSGGHWSPYTLNTPYLISVQSGKRLKLPVPEDVNTDNCSLSPNCRYVIYYDPDSNNFFSYNIISKVTQNLTVGFTNSWCNQFYRSLPKEFRHEASICGIIGWSTNDKSVFVYDENDIWQLDPTGKIPPICITNQLGRKNHIIFRLALDHPEAFSPAEPIFLKAFNDNTKESGFYSAIIGKVTDPEKILIGPFLANDFVEPGEKPIKAKHANVYLIKQMTASISPNYFLLRQNGGIKKISAVYPEKKTNWLTTELVSWETFDGEKRNGVLYKPNNFDRTKKYPLIIYYYRLLTEKLYSFQELGLSSGAMNIPWFVRRDYLVFCPDIPYTEKTPGAETYNTIISAVVALSKNNYIDANHIGLQGQSFGGYETNYLLTHSKLFAAAVSSSGVSDIIGNYLGFNDLGGSNQPYYEFGQGRIGKMLWEDRQSFLESSPILYADQVTAPVLLLTTADDKIVPPQQGIGFFLALARMGKKVWLLKYAKEAHSLGKNENCLDYTIRMQQFFDHYLKSAPAPKWMVEGIPASMKGIDDGLELEPPGIEPGPGLLTPEEQKKVDSLAHRKPITITIP